MGQLIYRRSMILILLWASTILAQDMVPFVIPLEMAPTSPLAWQDPVAIEVNSPRIEARDGHFVSGDKPIRLWGVNLSFGANFPSHEDAVKIATRMAFMGINSVRCHHMDTSSWPRGIWDAQHPGQLSHEALDRLDYFIDQLARQGIYADINLHVGREHSRFLDQVPPTEHNYDKIYNLFTPALITAQKDYARLLLTHVNPYRGVNYAHDPAVALVEITNENSFFMWDGDATLRSLKPFYATLLRAQYNTWLKHRYGSRAALAQAWDKEIHPLGSNLLLNSHFVTGNGAGPDHWVLERHNECQASAVPQAGGVRLEISRHDETGWHLQFNQRHLTLKQGQYYTLLFSARSDRPRTLHCTVGQAHDPWQDLGLTRSVALASSWQTYRLGFVAAANDTDARVSFSFGDDETPFVLRQAELRPGGQVGLQPKESWDANSIEVYADNESERRVLDRHIFLAQTEKAFFDQMRGFIRSDLDCGALVTGSIVFSPLSLYAQSDMDYVDAHAYWQHPRFPGRPWDPENWTIEQQPMVNHPQEATLFKLAARRLAGKPFTVSEYNHPAPLDTQSACVPMIASFAAAQNWDGIWFYTYSHDRDQWDRTHLSGFFDIDTNPAKWGFMRAGAELFRHRAVHVLGRRAQIALSDTSTGMLDQLARLQQQFGSELFKALSSRYSTGRSNLLRVQLSACLTGQTELWPVLGPSTHMFWGAEEGQGLYRVLTDCAWVLVGQSSLFAQATAQHLRLDAPPQASFILTSLDGRSLDESERILLTACGRCENTGMVFSADRRSVGRQWGTGPVLIEPVQGHLVLPPGQWQVESLSSDGLRSHAIALTNLDQQGLEMTLSQAQGTMWYLLERRLP